MRCAKKENATKLQAALDDEITIRDLRSPRTLKQCLETKKEREAGGENGKGTRGGLPEDPEKAYTAKLKGAAKIFVLQFIEDHKDELEDVGREDIDELKGEFLRLAGEQFKEQRQKLMEAATQGIEPIDREITDEDEDQSGEAEDEDEQEEEAPTPVVKKKLVAKAKR